MTRFLLIFAVIILIFSSFSALIPDTFTQGVDNAIVYFASSVFSLGFIFHVQTLFICLKILINFLLGVCIFEFFKIVLNFSGK